ncbi:MAG TPA: IPT/TIG domain-containing protein [Pantanalinema sp.]
MAAFGWFRHRCLEGKPRRALLGAGLLALLLVACQASPVRAPETSEPLSGRVSFPERRVQAEIGQVADAATVSLIQAALNVTVVTSLTTASGSFQLTFPRSFKPDPAATYYLEAVKGLASNMPGHQAARVRTLVKYNKGWMSLTNTVPNQGIVVDEATTALAIGAALRNENPAPLDFSSLIGRVTPGASASYAPAAAVSGQDFDALLILVKQALAADLDPVAGVGLVLPDAWVQVNQPLTLASVSPASGSVGTLVTVIGSGFLPTPASNSVTFNGVSAFVNSVSATTLVATVPAGATSGRVGLKIGGLSIDGPVFTVTGVVAGGVETGR